MGGRTPLPFGGWEHLGHILGNSFERLGHLTDVTNGTSYRECAFPATDRSHLFVARRIGGLLCAKGVALYLCEGGKGTKPPAIVGFPDFTESRLLERLHVARDNNITRQRLLPPPQPFCHHYTHSTLKMFGLAFQTHPLKPYGYHGAIARVHLKRRFLQLFPTFREFR
jgi:hypothetical protein